MSGQNGDKLTARQLQFIAALLQNPSQEAAGRSCKVPKATYQRWLQNPVFAQRLEATRESVFGEALQTVRAGAKAAAAELLRLLEAKSPAIRRLAADSILRNAFKSWELLELEARLQRLEGALSGEDQDKPALKFKFDYSKGGQDKQN
jgi:transposase